ncbi:DNA polymerase III subunit delta [Streptococcus sciuri]|uniref:DNA polymerase III subunit delta n=1 Tax=Streptococcus sciuri TaxID=2973939 RepID=A0ABT2F717_9STRE|nr:DNA polymerase III subunit delta [Streptococcus sciuri]MCS4488290.1 DNA polymerase III subunit delta [Streptococcus sciuri]
MIAIEEIEQLSATNLGNITVLAGDDLGQYSEIKQKLFERVGFDKSDLLYSYFDLSEDDYLVAEMDLESLPFLSDYKIVILDNFLDITTSKKNYLEEESLKRFETYLENPVATTRLILCAPGKLDGKRRLVKLLKRDAKVIEATVVKEAELKAYFQRYAHKEGLHFENGAFEDLLIKSNYDYSAIQKNLAFLISYKKTDNISSADIATAIPKTLQDNIFDLTQLVILGRVDESFALTHDLRLQGEDDIKLIAVMLGQFRTFLQVKLLFEQGKNESQITSDLSYYLGRKVNPYQVRYALRDARTLSISFLKFALKRLIETDEAIKRGSADKEYLFDKVLLQLITYQA